VTPLPGRRLAALCATAVAILSAICCQGSGDTGGPTSPYPPIVYLQLNSSSTVSQGDTVLFTISFSTGVTPGAPLYLQLAFDGGPPGTDTTTVPLRSVPGGGPVSLEGGLVIPDGIPDGVLTLTVLLPQTHDSASATITIKDTVPPSLNGTYVVPGPVPNAFFLQGGLPYKVLDFVAGGTDSIVMQATDNDALAWVGWQFGGPNGVRDSIRASGGSLSQEIPFTVPAALAGTAPPFSIFARDIDGNMAVDSFGQEPIASYLHHPMRSATVDTTLTDLAYDAKRNVLYLTEPKHASVLVLSLASMTYLSPILVPGTPLGLDLSPGGDTLVVALANTGDLAFVPLASGAHTPSIVHLTSLDSVPGDTTTFRASVAVVRVAADGRVIVGTSGYYAQLVDLDLTTDLNTVRFNAAYNPMLFARSGDGTHVVLTGVAGADMYNASSHGYSLLPSASGQNLYNGPVSSSQTGAYFGDGNALFDANLDALGTMETDNMLSGEGYGSSISNDGTGLFLGGAGRCSYQQAGENYGPCAPSMPGYYFRFKVPVTVATGNLTMPGQLIEVADAPQSVLQLYALPGNQILVAVGITQLTALDLTQSTPGAVSVVITARKAAPQATVTPSAGHTVGVRIGRVVRTLTLTVPALAQRALPDASR
jgi:hypothetical protein